MSGNWKDDGVETSCLVALNRRILRSLTYSPLHITRSLTITVYEAVMPVETDETSSHHVLSRMDGLHTLTLILCRNLPFIVSLPACNPSKIILCPNL